MEVMEPKRNAVQLVKLVTVIDMPPAARHLRNRASMGKLSCLCFSSTSSSERTMTNMSSTPMPSRRNGSTCAQLQAVSNQNETCSIKSLQKTPQGMQRFKVTAMPLALVHLRQVTPHAHVKETQNLKAHLRERCERDADCQGNAKASTNRQADA